MSPGPGSESPMLTREESIVVYDDATGCAIPDRLSRKTHAHYLKHAQRLLGVYEQGTGLTRRELHRAVENTLARLDDCPQRRIAAFQKLLDDVSEYHTDRGKSAAKLRQTVFTAAAKYHPLVSRVEGIFCNLEEAIKRQIATALKLPWEQIDAELFSDVIEFQRLKKFEGYATPNAFLARYNVAQSQAALYHAEQLTVWSRTDHKMILRYAKLARLMHSIRREPDGTYRFRFDGPASVLRSATRYGVAMARFLPGLLSCRDWTGVAKIRSRFGKRYRLELTSEDGLNADVAPAAEFDSDLEADFVADWEKADRDGWRLERETEVLHHGQTVFTPDFTLASADGQRVLLEIVGYWTPEYLKAKSQSLAEFRQHRILLAVPEQSNLEIPTGFESPIVFKRRLKPTDVLARLKGR